MKTYKRKRRIRPPHFTPAIHAYVKAKCTVEFIPACRKYRATITLNGYEYAVAKDSHDEAVEALAGRCARSYKLKRNWTK